MKQFYLMLSFLFLVGCNVKLGDKPNTGNNNNNGNPPSTAERLAIAPNSIYVQTIVNQQVMLSVYIQNKTSQVISGIVSSLGNNYSEINLINDQCLTAILAPLASCRLDFEMNSSIPITRTTTLSVTSAAFTSVADFVFKALPEPSNNSLFASNAFQFVNQGSVLSDDLSNYLSSGSATSYTALTQPSNGSLVLNNTTGQLSYTPNANFSGLDSFTFRANGSPNNSNTATYQIYVQDMASPPTSFDMLVAVNRNVPKQIVLTAQDDDNRPLSYSIVSQPSHGTLSGSGPNRTYTPSNNFLGNDSFTFKVNNGSFNSNTATVSITVTYDNQAPVASSSNINVSHNTPATFSLIANDADNDTLAYTIVSQPMHGTISGTGSSRTYTPNLNYSGSDSLSFKVNDGTADSNTAVIFFNVSTPGGNGGGPNQAPVAQGQSVATQEDSALPIVLTASDLNNDTLTYSIVSQPLHGSISGSGQNITYTPAANYFGSDSFTFKSNDGSLDSNVATISVSISSVNDAPVANNLSKATTKNTPANGIFSATDVENNALTYSVVTQPVNGIVSVSGSSFVYTPNNNYSGSDSFTYRANDGSLFSNTATVSLTIQNTNAAPVANNATYSLENTSVVNMMLVASDSDNNPLTYSIISQPAHGTLSGSGANYVFTPTSGYVGGDSFTFKVNDGTVDSNIATVSINILASTLNQAPVASNQSEIVVEDTPKTFTLSASDANSDPLTVVMSQAPLHGTVSFAGIVATYTPNLNYTGSDSFVYQVSDGSLTSMMATVSLTISPVNDGPSLAASSYSTNEDIAIVNFTVPAVDPENDVLTYTIVSTTSNGVLTYNNALKKFTYTPNLDYTGSDSFTVIVSDGQITSAPKTYPITVFPLNDAPVANAQSVATQEDTAKLITLVGSDPENSSLTYVITSQPSNGTLSGIAPNLTYTPNLNFNGSDSFTFKVNDGNLDSATATVSISVSSVNDAPVALGQSYSTQLNASVGVTLIGQDVENSPLSYSVVSQPSNGTLSGTAPNLTYTPNLLYSGSDSFTFKVNDGSLDSNVATISIQVNIINLPPVALPQAVAVIEDTPQAITLVGTDPNGDALSYIIVSQPSNGTITGSGSNIVYTPALNFNGVDSFVFKVNDGTVDSVPVTISLTISPVNDAPIALPQSVAVIEDTPKNILLQASDAENSPLTYSIVTQPLHGTIVGSGNSYTYTPASNYTGSDSFSFKANDGTIDSNIATISVNVSGLNDAPVASNQSQTLVEDTSKNLTLSASDSDGDAISYVIVSAPTNGTLSGTAPNLTYTPALNYNGVDSFTFKSNDGSLDSNVATVSLTITPMNDAPVSLSQSVAVVEDTAKNITLQASDVENSSLSYTIVSQPLHGTLSGSGANVVYTPSLNYIGSDSFSFKVNDGSLDSNVSVVSITVSGINDAPIASNQSQTLVEDTTKNITLSSSDSDGDALTYTIVSQPANGTLSGTIPNLTYTPNANFNGSDSFTFKSNDGIVDSNVATVSLTVTPVNDAPIALNQSQNLAEDTTKNIVLSGTDVDGNALTYTVLTQPTNGVLSGSGNTFVYTPSLDYTGSDSFTFKVNDGTVDSNTATVSLTISGANDAPIAANQSQTLAEDSTENIILMASDSDGNSLTYSIVTQPLHGTLVGSGNAYVYTPALNYNGSDSFTFKANDGIADSNTASVSLTVTPVNDAPVANNQSQTLAEDSSLNLILSGNDPDGNTLSYSIVTQPLNGTLSGSGNSYTYTPGMNYTGSDSFTFKINDGTVDSNIATVSLSISGSNDAPIASNQSQTLAEDSTKNITLLATDADGNTLTYSIVMQPVNGTLSGSGNSFVYTPTLNYTGADSFTFKANDGSLDSNVATVSLSVTPVNDAPVANNQSKSLAEDSSTNLILSATDVDGNPLTYVIESQPLHGTLVGSGNSYSYTPASNYTGSDNFTFKANDGSLDSNVATVSLNVTSINDAPIASNQSQTLLEDTAKNLTLSATDSEGDTLNYTIVSAPTSGTLSGTAPSLIYTPNANYNGSDSFTYKVNDGNVDSNVATVSLTVTPVNDAPISLAQSVSVIEDTAKNITLQATDTENSPLTYSIVTQPTNGVLTGSGNSYVYTPNLNYTGADSFTFKSNDGLLDSNIATVSLTVSAVNDAPIASNQSQNLLEDTTKTITLSATDSDGNTLTYTIVTQPSNGTLSGSGNSFVYTPALNYNGADSFTFKANDGTVDSNVATVSLTISAVNDAPIATNMNFSTNEDVAYNGTLTASDVDLDTLTYSIVGTPSHGTVTIINLQTGAFVYTPTANYNGADSFSFMVNDGTINSNIATVAVSVLSTNDAPIAQSQSLSTTEDVAKNIVLVATDLDNNPLSYTIVSSPVHGTISGTLPNIVYTPVANYNGADSFTFKANDGSLDSNIATVSLTITSVNDAPVSQNLVATTTEDVSVGVVLSATDAENNALTYTIVTAPAHGTLTGSAPNLTYVPAANYNGTDSFTYKANDGSLDSNISTVNITINALNDAPVASNLSISTNKNTAVTSQVVASDVESSTLAYSVVLAPAHGTVTMNSSTGSFTYTPTTGYFGADSFTYKVNDGSLNSNTATVGINVIKTNQAPVAQNKIINAYLDQITVTDQALATDADGDALTYSLVGSNPSVIMNANGSFTFTNSSNLSTVTISFKANDGLLNSNTASITLNFVLRDNSLKLETNPDLVAHTLNNYPLLLDLQAFAHQEHFWSNVQANGGDIVLTLSDKITKIPLDVRNFNKTSRTGQLWFKSNVLANTKNGFYLHYNNTGTPALTQPVKTSTYGAYNVWNNSAIAYWDMHKNGSSISDATINQHNLTVYFNPLSDLNSYIDQGVLFNSDGLKDDVVKALSTPVSKLNFEVTISAWVYPTKSVSDSIILKKEGTSGKNNYYLGLDNLKPSFTFDNNCGKKTIDSSIAVPLNEWSLVTGTFNQTTMRSRLYINGVLVKEGNQSDHFPDYHDSLSDSRIQIGGQYGANKYEFVGTIDELNLHASAWSQEFIKNYYNMTNQPNTYWLIDSEQVVFSDSFNRVNSNTIGNSWTELEGCSLNANSSLNLLGLLGINITISSAGCGYVKNYSDQVNFYGLTDPQAYPELSRTLTSINSGKVFLSFYVDFLRQSTEADYSVFMNIGEANKNIASLVWGSPSFGLTSHTGIGFVNSSNTITQLKTLNHRELVVFSIDFTNKTIGIYLKGAGMSSVPFDDASSVLSKISFIVSRISSSSVPRIYFDNVIIKKK